MLILNKQDSIHAATKLIKYFKDFERIDDYFRARKIERVKNIPAPLPGFGLEDDMFQAYDMHPIAVFGSETDFDAHGMVE